MKTLSSVFFAFVATVITMACSKMPNNHEARETIVVHDTTVVYTDSSSTMAADTIRVITEFGLRADKHDSLKHRFTPVYVRVAGLYSIFANIRQNSGTEQLNESAYILVNTRMPYDGTPYVVMEDRNTQETEFTMYGGLFYMRQGINYIETYHVCTIKEYDKYINGRIRGAESVYIRGFIVCPF